jgi:ABC-2 type transport system permease protein
MAILRRPQIIDRSVIDRTMDNATYTFVLDIPPQFEADILRERVPALQRNIDATAMTHAGVGSSYIESIVQQEARNYLQSRGIGAQLPVTAVARAYFNPNLEGSWFTAITVVIDDVTMLSILLVGAAIIRSASAAPSNTSWLCRSVPVKSPPPRSGQTASSSWLRLGFR